MPLQELTPFQRGTLRIMRVLAVALILGVGMFLAVSLFIVHGPMQQGALPGADMTLLIWLPLGLAVVIIVLRSIVPRMASEAQIRRLAAGEDPFQAMRSSMSPQQAGLLPPADASPSERLFPVYLSRMLIGMAMLEGAAFFALICFIITGHEVPLATAIGVLVLQILAFPTRTRVEHWVENQLQTHDFAETARPDHRHRE